MTSREERQRRLLDLLAGWTAYVTTYPSPCEEEVDAIANLYQTVGAIEDAAFDADALEHILREIRNIIRTGGSS